MLPGLTYSYARRSCGNGDRKQAEAEREEMLVRLQQYAGQLRGLTELEKIKILIVDDDADSRDITFVLQQEKAEVIAVSSALEALQILAKSKLDVLLSDIGMPEMDGYMLICQVRKWLPEQGGQIPAIVTAYAGEYDQQQAISAGFQIHVPKPAEPAQLIAAVTKLVGIMS